MTERNYPTRMHEVLTKPGELPLQTGEIFTINEDDYGFYHMLDCEGQIIFADQEDAKEYRITADMVTSAINHGITRRPQLTEEQVEQLKAAQLLVNAKWLAKDKDGGVVLFGRKPNRDGDMSAWIDDDCNYWWFLPSDTPLSGLVSWSDPAPLDIVQTLRDAGVEIEEDK